MAKRMAGSCFGMRTPAGVRLKMVPSGKKAELWAVRIWLEGASMASAVGARRMKWSRVAARCARTERKSRGSGWMVRMMGTALVDQAAIWDVLGRAISDSLGVQWRALAIA